MYILEGHWLTSTGSLPSLNFPKGNNNEFVERKVILKKTHFCRKLSKSAPTPPTPANFGHPWGNFCIWRAQTTLPQKFWTDFNPLNPALDVNKDKEKTALCFLYCPFFFLFYISITSEFIRHSHNCNFLFFLLSVCQSYRFLAFRHERYGGRSGLNQSVNVIF